VQVQDQVALGLVQPLKKLTKFSFKSLAVIPIVFMQTISNIFVWNKLKTVFRFYHMAVEMSKLMK